MNLPKAYSTFYGICLTQRYRDTLLFWLRENNPAAYRRVVKDHKLRNS
jgi:hypothetical protein